LNHSPALWYTYNPTNAMSSDDMGDKIETVRVDEDGDIFFVCKGGQGRHIKR